MHLNRLNFKDLSYILCLCLVNITLRSASMASREWGPEIVSLQEAYCCRKEEEDEEEKKSKKYLFYSSEQAQPGMRNCNTNKKE